MNIGAQRLVFFEQLTTQTTMFILPQSHSRGLGFCKRLQLPSVVYKSQTRLVDAFHALIPSEMWQITLRL